VVASARAVSTPMSEAPPVTMIRLPPNSMPATASAAVDCALNGVVMGVVAVMIDFPVSTQDGAGSQTRR
jgi:hypothetical protein